MGDVCHVLGILSISFFPSVQKRGSGLGFLGPQCVSFIRVSAQCVSSYPPQNTHTIMSITYEALRAPSAAVPLASGLTWVCGAAV